MNENPNKANDITEDDGSDMRVTLSLDDGSDVECAILTIFDVGEQNYIALLPLDENGEGNEDGEVYIYRYYFTLFFDIYYFCIFKSNIFHDILLSF